MPIWNLYFTKSGDFHRITESGGYSRGNWKQPDNSFPISLRVEVGRALLSNVCSHLNYIHLFQIRIPKQWHVTLPTTSTHTYVQLYRMTIMSSNTVHYVLLSLILIHQTLPLVSTSDFSHTLPTEPTTSMFANIVNICKSRKLNDHTLWNIQRSVLTQALPR